MSSSGGNVTYDVATLTVEQFYDYQPSLALACVALSLFTLAGVAVTVLTERYRRRFVHLIRWARLARLHAFDAAACVIVECAVAWQHGRALGPAPAPQPLPPPRHALHRLPACSITALCEALGYASLIVSIERSGKGDIYPFYVMTQVLVVLSPNLIQAAEYWTVRGVKWVGWLAGVW